MEAFLFVGRQELGGGGIRRGVVGYVGDEFLCLGFDHVFEELLGQFFVRAGGGNHQVIDPTRCVLLRDGFVDGEIEFVELVGHERPTHGGYDFVILEEVGEIAAGGPVLADVGLQVDELLFYGFEFGVAEVVEMARIRLVVAENLRGHVDAGEFVPERDFSFVLRIPEDGPGIGWLFEGGRVVEQGIGAPDEGDAVSLVVGFDQRGVAKTSG